MEYLDSGSSDEDDFILQGDNRQRAYRDRINMTHAIEEDSLSRFRLSDDQIETILNSIGAQLESPTNRSQALSPVVPSSPSWAMHME